MRSFDPEAVELVVAAAELQANLPCPLDPTLYPSDHYAITATIQIVRKDA